MHAVVVRNLQVVVDADAAGLDVLAIAKGDRPAWGVANADTFEKNMVTVVKKDRLGGPFAGGNDALLPLPVLQKRLLAGRQSGPQFVPVKEGPVRKLNRALAADGNVALMQGPQQGARFSRFPMFETIGRIVFKSRGTAKNRTRLQPQRHVRF